MINLTVYGKPTPQGSMRVARGRMFSDNPHLDAWRQAIGYAALAVRPVMFARHVPLSVSLLFVFAKPSTASKAQAYPSIRPDLDKLVRAVFDALTGIAWVDDSQIVHLKDVWKTYGEPERAEITIEAV